MPLMSDLEATLSGQRREGKTLFLHHALLSRSTRSHHAVPSSKLLIHLEPTNRRLEGLRRVLAFPSRVFLLLFLPPGMLAQQVAAG